MNIVNLPKKKEMTSFKIMNTYDRSALIYYQIKKKT